MLRISLQRFFAVVMLRTARYHTKIVHLLTAAVTTSMAKPFTRIVHLIAQTIIASGFTAVTQL